MPNLNVLSQLPEGKASTVGCSFDLRRIIQTWGDQPLLSMRLLGDFAETRVSVLVGLANDIHGGLELVWKIMIE